MISGEESSFVGYTFVDGTDLVTAGNDNETYQDVVNRCKEQRTNSKEG